MKCKRAYDAVFYYMNDLTSEVVAKSGISTDRHHLGKIIHHSLKADPEFLSQIDGATDQSETNGSVLNRSIRCAIAFQKLGLKKGDVIVLMAPNHIDLCIPIYASLFLGIIVAAVDANLTVNELEDTFNIRKPKLVFCQSEKSSDIEKALALAGLEDSTVMTFNRGDHTTLAELLTHANDEEVEDFKVVDFDPAETPAFLTSTSGTTGTPKAAILTHKNLCISTPFFWILFTKYPRPTRMVLVMSPLQWLTAGFQYLFTPILKVIRLQTSAPITTDHFVHLLNTYKPTYTNTSSVLLNSMLVVSDKCDFTCFEVISMGGSPVPQELIKKLKELTKSEEIYDLYGCSEIGGLAFQNDYPPPPGSSGTTRGALEYRLVDPKNNEDIHEPNVTGELWLRGPAVFKGYYNNPKATAETLTEDGWLKTGDMFYRNEFWHFFFVDRLKSLLKYKNHQISPTEVERVIKKLPGVLDVCVTGVPADQERGDLVVACVIPMPGFNPTAQEVKDIVKEYLSDSKQLRGGVVFMNEFPITSSTKINRKKLQDMVLTMKRE